MASSKPRPPARKVAVVGGGTAGLAAALALKRRGAEAIIVESESAFGGKASGYGCKGLGECVRCDVCLAKNLVKDSINEEVVRYRNSHCVSLSGGPGDFELTVDSSGRTERLQVAAVIVATGSEAFDARLDKRLGAGAVPNVIPASEVESSLYRTGRLLTTDGVAPRSVAFVQCVGSRGPLGSGACSRVCCKYSLKMAQALKRRYQDAAITYFFMDWRPSDAQDDLRAWAEAQKGVRLIRSRPSEILSGEDGSPLVRYASEDDASIVEHGFDIVVLSVGLVPSPNSAQVANAFGLETDATGYIQIDERTSMTSRRGVFAAGCCTGPMDIRASAEQGVAAASAAVDLLEDVR
ncbi:MAG TPA: FAD-dependent oxidoreductase [Methanomassiliicoccales archaeon]|nr:FAD-dependent oxidoreductase [Methanomassiliicoccales archaeon]